MNKYYCFITDKYNSLRFTKFDLLRSIPIVTIIMILITLNSLKANYSHQDQPELQKDYLQTHIYDSIENNYIVKPGDTFIIAIKAGEAEEMIIPVSISGNIIIHPFTSSIKIAGNSLRTAREKIYKALAERFHDAEIDIELLSISPQRIHLLGAVKQPGEYVVDSLLTLYNSLQKAGGIVAGGSRKVNILRKGTTKEYDLNDYLLYGNLEENPLLFNDDVVFVDFAEEYAKIYIVTDSVNYVEHFEIENDKPLKDLLKTVANRHDYSDYSNLSVIRDNQLIHVDHSFLVKPGDEIYLNEEESVVYVTGSVSNPGKYNYVPGKDPLYYLSIAGGVDRDGSSNKVIIVDNNGFRQRYNGQPIESGDTLIVPLSTRAYITDYLTPVSTVLSLITTLIIIVR